MRNAKQKKLLNCDAAICTIYYLCANGHLLDRLILPWKDEALCITERALVVPTLLGACLHGPPEALVAEQLLAGGRAAPRDVHSGSVRKLLAAHTAHAVHVNVHALDDRHRVAAVPSLDGVPRHVHLLEPRDEHRPTGALMGTSGNVPNELRLTTDDLVDRGRNQERASQEHRIASVESHHVHRHEPAPVVVRERVDVEVQARPEQRVCPYHIRGHQDVAEHGAGRAVLELEVLNTKLPKYVVVLERAHLTVEPDGVELVSADAILGIEHIHVARHMASGSQERGGCVVEPWLLLLLGTPREVVRERSKDRVAGVEQFVGKPGQRRELRKVQHLLLHEEAE